MSMWIKNEGRKKMKEGTPTGRQPQSKLGEFS